MLSSCAHSHSPNHRLLLIIAEFLVLSVLLCLPIQAGANVKNGLVAYYPFEGNTKDYSGYGHDGTAGSALSYTTGVQGQCATLNGAIVTIADTDVLDTDYTFTLAAWVYPTLNNPTNSYHTIVSKYYTDPTAGDYVFKIGQGKTEVNCTGCPGLWVSTRNPLFVSDHLYDSNDLIPLNTWTHLTATFDNGLAKLYINGQLTEQSTLSISNTDPEEYSHDNVIIGGIWTANSSYGFKGSLDEVRIYNRALSAEEVSTLAQREYSESLDFTFSEIGASQVIGVPFTTTITCQYFYNGDVYLSSNLGARVSPTVVHLTNGTWTGEVTVLDPGCSMSLNATADGSRGESNFFTVGLPSGQPQGSLYGQVLDQNRQALNGAIVTLSLDETAGSGDLTATVTGGYYRFENVPPCKYYLWASYSGFESETLTTALAQDQTVTEDITIATAAPQGNIPILFVPGIMGSTHKKYLRNLPAMPPGIKPSDMVLVDPLWTVGWHTLESYLTSSPLTYQSGVDVFRLPYDWTMKVEDIAREVLKPKIDQIKAKTGMSQVYVVAHSMGGLVARTYIQSNYFEQDIAKLITVGTPHRGSMDGYMLWASGAPNGFVERFAIDNTCPQAKEEADAAQKDAIKKGLSEDAAYETWLATYNYRVHEFLHDSVKSLGQIMATYPSISDDYGQSCGPLRPLMCYANTWLNELNADTDGLARFAAADSTDPTKVPTKVFRGCAVKTALGYTAWGADCGNQFFKDGRTNQFHEIPSPDADEGDGTVPCQSSLFIDGVSDHKDSVLAPKHSELVRYFARDIVEELTGYLPPDTEEPESTSLDAPQAGDYSLLVDIQGNGQAYLQAPGGSESGIKNGQVIQDIASSQVLAGYNNMSIGVGSPADGAYVLHLSCTQAGDFRVTLSLFDNAGDKYQATTFLIYHDGGDASYSVTLAAAAAEPFVLTHTPAQPQGLTASPWDDSGTLMTGLAWQASADPGVTGYRIYYRRADYPSYQPLGSTSGTSYQTSAPWAADSTTPVVYYAVAARYADDTESVLTLPVANNDRDGDGLSDAEEPLYGANLNLPDTDGDGLGDLAEKYYGTLPDNPDCDLDGFSDAVEVRRGSDPWDYKSIPPALPPILNLLIEQP